MFENFFVFLKTVQQLEEEFSMCVDLVVSKELNNEYLKRQDLRSKNGLTKGLHTVESWTEECRRKINFIVTLGGDGTILWASKQFSGQYVPPMITFDQGSLGFLCNFVFEDHEEVMKHVFESIFSKKESEFLGLDSRMRLRVNMGAGNET